MKANKKRFHSLILAGIVAACSIFTSCDRVIGYSVLLWNDRENKLEDGTIVPVYFKSNISKVYIAGLPDSKKEKIEVPLWQLSNPESKSKAIKRAKRYEEYRNTYAKSIIDGLPIRDDKVNISKQVYRLRKNETVRTLFKGNGVAPTKGGKPLEGEWLYVLTSNGTEGWCFSYNLKLFQMTSDSVAESQNDAEVSTEEEQDTVLENILNTTWYPDYYTTMIAKKQIDPEYFRADYTLGFNIDDKKITIKCPSLEGEYPYENCTRTEEREYDFEGSPVHISARGHRTLVFKYTDDRGMPHALNFVSLGDRKVDQIVQEELGRRARLYKSIVSFGPDFKSGNYGTISFNDDSTFTWTGFGKLVPSVIPQGSKGRGTVEIKYFIPENLKSSWDGMLTLHFDGKEPEVNFLFKQEVAGLRLAVGKVTTSWENNGTIKQASVSLPANSIVLFFQK